MSKCFGIENFEEQLNKNWDMVNKEWEEKTKPLLEQAKKSIKHPHFFYAEVDLDTKEITYKRKKWYKWFSGKRIAHTKFRVEPIVCKGLPEYKIPIAHKMRVANSISEEYAIKGGERYKQ